IIPSSLSSDEKLVMRQALAGMLWSKQYYAYDVGAWLRARGQGPFSGRTSRNTDWYFMENANVFSMPDTWEYPWYAAWDLAFHCTALAIVDPQFAKDQLELVLGEAYLHPNGQVPAYEWNFSDVNPPVHGWAALYVYRVDAHLHGADTDFLKRIFRKLLL